MKSDSARDVRFTPGIIGLVISLILLIPGLLLPAIQIKGKLDSSALSQLTPVLLEQGLTDSATAGIAALLNPALIPLLETMPGGVKGAIINVIGGQVGNSLAGAPPVEVYQQTRSILGSVRQLYRVGSWVAASLILLFSVVVPFTKLGVTLRALTCADPVRRQRLLRFITSIGKWSMADVFAVALIIAWLAAVASQGNSGSSTVLFFEAGFGPGFYWFAAYCVVSLAVTQFEGSRE